MSANAETMNEILRDEEAPLFVINLCASTTPVALTQPGSPELKRYTFFVTRRREEGRERFRLHMGYFDTLAEAEVLLAEVREVYPAAWAGPAPGNKPAPRTAPVQAVAKPAVAVAQATAVDAAPAGPVPVAVAAAAPAPQMSGVPGAPGVSDAPVVSAAHEVREVPVAPPPPLELSLVEDQPRESLRQVAADCTLDDMSNVREVLAALEDGPTRSVSPPVLQPLVTRSDAPPSPQPVAASASVLSPRQERSLLERGTPVAAVDDSSVRMMTPEDTQTLRDIRFDQENQAPPCFAVQLVWSATPIDMASLTQLAIFNAYTLYHVEGNRQGRRWYGVRLGFFSDVTAAKQVAYFMKADYASVVVVPVTVKERARASGDSEGAPAAKAAVAKVDAVPAGQGLDGFELLPDAAAAAAPPDTKPQRRTSATPAAKAAPKSGRARAAGKSPGKRVVARSRRAEPGQPQPLEETLELLGASTLSLDEDRKSIVDDSALLRPGDARKKPGGLRFSKLLGRLSEKLGDRRR